MQAPNKQQANNCGSFRSSMDQGVPGKADGVTCSVAGHAQNAGNADA